MVLSPQGSSSDDVVLTGCGVVSPLGLSLPDYWGAIVAQRSGVATIASFSPGDFPVRLSAEVRDFDPQKFVRPRKSLKVMCRDIQLMFAAADMAIGDAGLADFAKDPDRMGVVLGADMMYSPVSELKDAFLSCRPNGKFDFQLWGDKAHANMFPLWMLKYLPNMPACHVAIAHDARGPNNTVMLGEVSSLVALQEAVRVIRRGQVDIMVTGGGACRNHPGTYVFRGNSHLSHRNNDPPGASRPFDQQRDGTVNGEGAAAFVLERRSHAEARGARILARVRGYASRVEPISEPHQHATGAAVYNSILGALESAGMTPDEIGHVNANGLATIEEDQVEAQAIRKALGDVPVTAPKSFFGCLGAGSGAVEMLASVLGMQEERIPTTLNYTHPDPACPINVVHGDMAPMRKSGALLLNQNMTGQAVAVVLDKP